MGRSDLLVQDGMRLRFAGLLQKKAQDGTQTTMEATLMAQQTPGQREQVRHTAECSLSGEVRVWLPAHVLHIFWWPTSPPREPCRAG